MADIYKNITGNTATDLECIRNVSVDYNTIRMCNVHASDGVNVDLYLFREENATSTYFYDEHGRRDDGSYDIPAPTTFTYYILKNVSIPKGATLFLDKDTFYFNNRKYSLYIKLSGADSAVDVIINATEKGRPSKRIGQRINRNKSL